MEELAFLRRIILNSIILGGITLKDNNDMENLAQSGSIMVSIGITTVELAEKLKTHVLNCPGGQRCIEQLLENNQ